MEVQWLLTTRSDDCNSFVVVVSLCVGLVGILIGSIATIFIARARGLLHCGGDRHYENNNINQQQELIQQQNGVDRTLLQNEYVQGIAQSRNYSPEPVIVYKSSVQLGSTNSLVSLDGREAGSLVSSPEFVALSGMPAEEFVLGGSYNSLKSEPLFLQRPQ